MNTQAGSATTVGESKLTQLTGQIVAIYRKGREGKVDRFTDVRYDVTLAYHHKDGKWYTECDGVATEVKWYNWGECFTVEV